MATPGDVAANVSAMPANATIYLIRHAEKPDSGPGLSPAGQARAEAYVQYLQKQTDPAGKSITWNYLFASQDSDNSDRPELTITPLAQALKLAINCTYKDKDYQNLAAHIQKHAKDRYANSNILICWHHGEILQLAQAMGAAPSDLPPSSDWPAHWPETVFGWLLKIYYKQDGTLHHAETQAINERLMPDDTAAPVYNQ
jgi:phosphohistidine phosphatase SixA